MAQLEDSTLQKLSEEHLKHASFIFNTLQTLVSKAFCHESETLLHMNLSEIAHFYVLIAAEVAYEFCQEKFSF